jgi:hypothetical protein
MSPRLFCLSRPVGQTDVDSDSFDQSITPLANRVLSPGASIIRGVLRSVDWAVRGDPGSTNV